MGRNILRAKRHSLCRFFDSRRPTVIFATAQFKSSRGRFHFWKFVPDPIRHRQLPGAHSDRQCAFNFTLRDAIGVFSMGLSWGMPGAFIGLPVTIALFTIWQRSPSTR